MVAAHLRQRESDDPSTVDNYDRYYINEPELRKILRTHIAIEGDNGDEVDMIDIILH